MHVGIIGLSGVGKTYFLENLIRQDIDHGTGFALFDVHGDLADNIVTYVAERAKADPGSRDRLVLIEPFDPTYSVGFNPLERSGQTSPYVQAQELAYILRSRWESYGFGPRTEELLRNAIYALSAQGLTLLELPDLLANNSFRTSVVRKLQELTVAEYWKSRYDTLSPAMKAAVREPLLTRVSSFLADPQVREVVGQRKSTFTFREAIEKGLWVVINLSKGKLGENSTVLGSLLFTKLELDVMAQAHRPQADRRLFAIYADELQNLASSNFATLVAEARKYQISIVAGHQYWRQLSPEMRAAMLGVGSRVFFRLHYHDARELAGEIDPRETHWYTELLTRLPRGEAVFRSGSRQAIPFTVIGHHAPRATPAVVDALRQYSRARYGVSRGTIRRDMESRRQAQPRIDAAQHLAR